MEEKKIRMSLSTFLLIMAIVIILVTGMFIYILESREKVELDLESEIGQELYRYMDVIREDFYNEDIAEFDDIKNAPKEYLAYVVAENIMYNVGDSATFEDFNAELIDIFGERANGLLNNEKIEELVGFAVKNDDGTYHFGGLDGSETIADCSHIKSIEKKDNVFYVELYEFIEKWKYMSTDLEDGDEDTLYVYDKASNLINTFKTIFSIEPVGNQGDCYEKRIYYDETGNQIEQDSIDEYIINRYDGKLSVRYLELEYDEKIGKFYLLRNRLENPEVTDETISDIFELAWMVFKDPSNIFETSKNIANYIGGSHIFNIDGQDIEYHNIVGSVFPSPFNYSYYVNDIVASSYENLSDSTENNIMIFNNSYYMRDNIEGKGIALGGIDEIEKLNETNKKVICLVKLHTEDGERYECDFELVKDHDKWKVEKFELTLID